jgi:branched-subunit amino acid aminotransferase/4-amino-4-deoxychorismate lyase
MATAAQPQFEDEDGSVFTPKSGHTLPGHTVDALLAEGKAEEAGVELERLLQEGIDSGISNESSGEMMKRLRARATERAATR